MFNVISVYELVLTSSVDCPGPFSCEFEMKYLPLLLLIGVGSPGIVLRLVCFE